MNTKHLCFFIVFILISCHEKNEKINSTITKAEKTAKELPSQIYSENNYTEIWCDSVYSGKGIKIILQKFDTKNDNESVFNSTFSVYQLKGNQYIEIFRDSVFRQFDDIKFEDFNGDHVKDILIENMSDVRSNLTYYLYLTDLKNNKIKKIKGFEQIKNPHYLPKYNLIDNQVMSGRNWTAFYKIKGDRIKTFEEDQYIVYWGEDENGNVKNPENEYRKKLSKILKEEKNK